MSGDSEKEGLTPEELESQTAEALPDREAMSIVWIEPEPMPVESSGEATKELPADHGIEIDAAKEPLRGGDPQL